MNRYLDLDVVRHELQKPFPSGRMNTGELGDSLARLVWESFSDFLADPEYESELASLGVPLEDGIPPERVAEELLIFHMWAHSRAVQLSFVKRLPAEQVRALLDHLHGAVFEDMVANGTPDQQIPVFEQRVSARYAEYYAAAEQSDEHLGVVALGHLEEAGAAGTPGAARTLTERAVEVAEPLRDYLEGIELVAA